jgi:hypothetical protein
MKLGLVAIMGAAALMVSASAFAGSKGSARVELWQPAKVAGQALKTGEYRLSWVGEGQDVAVTLGQGKNKVETRGKLVDRQNGEQGVVLKKDADGALHVTEIRLDKNRSLVLAES